MQSHNTRSSDVAVFWDYENCHASSQVSGYEIVSAIRNVAHRFGPVKHFKAYMEIPDPDTSKLLSLRSELQSSGVSLTDCPHNGRKNVADQMIMVDMLAYAMDHPAPATLILISGDRDFAYAVSVLRLRRYEVVIISLPLPGTHISLKSQASLCLDWNSEVLGYSSSASHFEGRAKSPTAPRNPFNFQSPSRRKSSSLPTPETPSSRAPLLPSKHDTKATGFSRRASYFGDPFFVPKAEPKAAPSSMSNPALCSVRAERPPGLRERPEVVVSAPVHSTNIPQVVGKNTIGPTCISPPFSQGSDKTNGTILMPVQSQYSALPLHCDSPVKSGQPTAISLTPELSPTEFTSIGDSFAFGTAVACSLADTSIPTERNDANLPDSASSLPLLSDESPSARVAINQPSGLPILEHVDPQAANPDPSTAPFHTAPIESVKHIPLTFRPLVTVLLKHAGKGVARPLRSTVGFELVDMAKKVYKEAGVANFSQFTALAEQEKIVQMGGSDGHAWISLHRDWSSRRHDGHVTQAGKEPALQSVSVSSSRARKKIPPVFQTLVDVLESYRIKGVDRPLRSAAVEEMLRISKTVYQQAGVKNFAQFGALAEKEKIIELGGGGGKEWISFHRDWLFRIYVECARVAARAFSSSRSALAGHNKWSKIKEKKGINDVKKNAAYTKASREIMTAVRLGGSADPEKNSALAAILRRLKDIPKENIQNALDKAIRKRDQRGEDIVYEALAYNKVALMIARIAPVRFMFDRVGSVKAIAKKEPDELALLNLIDIAMDNGAEDVKEILSTDTEVEFQFTCPPESLGQLTTALSTPGVCEALLASEVIFAPIDADSTVGKEDPDMANKIADLVREIEDDEDTKRVWTSWTP
ncbi:hypothetical protein MVEN_02072600 [Mycena venus]|uniref:NYN domain-containing protein n=1 Tax=Mycena venus TaxID=2733690 RepID=A0A8H6XD92_9AGAR|nr:hypothetical protein MVEN_02072600 [Mycena venus]